MAFAGGVHSGDGELHGELHGGSHGEDLGGVLLALGIDEFQGRGVGADEPLKFVGGTKITIVRLTMIE